MLKTFSKIRISFEAFKMSNLTTYQLSCYCCISCNLLIGYNQALLPAARMLAHTVALKKEHL